MTRGNHLPIFFTVKRCWGGLKIDRFYRHEHDALARLKQLRERGYWSDRNTWIISTIIDARGQYEIQEPETEINAMYHPVPGFCKCSHSRAFHENVYKPGTFGREYLPVHKCTRCDCPDYDESSGEDKKEG
jgi:hypothetical protein